MSVALIPPPAGGSGPSSGLIDLTGDPPIVVTPFGTDRVVSLSPDAPPITGALPPGVFLGELARRVGWANGNSGNTSNTVSGWWTFNGGTWTSPAYGHTTVFDSCARLVASSAASINAVTGTIMQNNSYARGFGTDLGGFTASICIGFTALNADSRIWTAWKRVDGGVAGNTEPSAVPGCVMLACDSTDTNLQIMHSSFTSGAPCTKIDTGWARPTPNVSIYLFQVSCPPSANYVDWMVKRMDDLTIAPISGRITSNLPESNTASASLEFLGWMPYVGTGPTTAVAVGEAIFRACVTGYQ